jgi:hypothetical protein
MTIGRGLIAFAILAAVSSCASPGMPPGGPVDTNAPLVIGIVPDSGTINAKPGAVVFKFDKTVAERPSGAPSLADLFLISPRDGVLNAAWHRGTVDVKPSKGWKPNTAYTITMLPGMTDLRGNVRKTSKVTVFSTGPQIPTSRLTGVVFNWVSGSVAQHAFIEARPRADTSTNFVAVGDSVGAFAFANLPPGPYKVRGILDENNNKGLDAHEGWDTTTVSLTDSARIEIFAFPHDSVAPRLTEVGIRDSVTLELIFDRPIDPNLQITPTIIGIKRSDSTEVAVLSVARGGPTGDATAALTGLRPSRPTPSSSLLVKLGIPLRQATTLRIRAVGIRSLDGIAKTSERVALVDPNPPKKTPPAVPPAGAPTTAPPTTRPPTTPRPTPPPPPPPPPASQPKRK